MKHKHAELIHAWADGATIQVNDKDTGEWVDATTPVWWSSCEYRIKPEEKKPVVRWLWVYKNFDNRLIQDQQFYTEVEVQDRFYKVRSFQRLDWTRTEFEE